MVDLELCDLFDVYVSGLAQQRPYSNVSDFKRQGATRDLPAGLLPRFKFVSPILFVKCTVFLNVFAPVLQVESIEFLCAGRTKHRCNMTLKNQSALISCGNCVCFTVIDTFM
ncbi:unnamed protein product [Clavelina lepadiformis]|uniref:Uncharacterized protein n=1 Tax=Clavelina lepadiformis TaxID=159417 RepID=A0ABP0GD77_CLALP